MQELSLCHVNTEHRHTDTQTDTQRLVSRILNTEHRHTDRHIDTETDSQNTLFNEQREKHFRCNFRFISPRRTVGKASLTQDHYWRWIQIQTQTIVLALALALVLALNLALALP